MNFYEYSSKNGFDKYKHIINDMHGYLCEGQPECLFSLAHISQPGNLVEIGSFKGKSSCCIATAIIGQNKHLYCIDPFTRQPTEEYSDPIWEYSIDDFNNNLKKCQVSDYVTPIKGFSQNIGKSWDKPISLIFVDGARTFEQAKDDIDNFMKWLIPNGIMLVHDVDGSPNSPWSGVYNAWINYAVPHLKDIGSVSSLAYGYKS